MSFPYNSEPEGETVLKKLKTLLQSKHVYIAANRRLVFVCGGATGGGNLRTEFLAYASTALPHLRLVLAEEAFKDLVDQSPPSFNNLAQFEQVLAHFADCILVFPESYGSVAELGYFCAFDPIVDKLLAVNRLEFQAHDSFINLGPIAIINAHSAFRPTLHVTNGSPTNFGPIADRLARFANNRRETFVPQTFASLSTKHKLVAICELVRSIRIVHVATLPRVIDVVFGSEPDPQDLKAQIAILVAARYIDRRGADERYLVATNTDPFFEADGLEDILVDSNAYLLKAHSALYTELFA